jgi:hypothetical protein
MAPRIAVHATLSRAVGSESPRKGRDAEEKLRAGAEKGAFELAKKKGVARPEREAR